METLSMAAAVMSLVCLVYGGVTIVLLRQHGRLLLRADAIERRVGPLKEGEAVPSLVLEGLDGKSLDLGTIRGRPTLLLFWDPANCNCQSMVPDVKTQERVRLSNAPDLILVASGSAEANAAHGFQSRVLLDPDLAARALFGAEFTPAGVLIDEHGRVASEVRAGYVPAFEMIGLVPFVPSAEATVQGMLALAGVGSHDVLYDLGCGDGRIVVAAAATCGARAVGVDINPERLAEGRANARKASVEHLVTFREGEISAADLSDATVVTMYLLPQVNLELRHKLLAELKPGTRVVSHAFDMDEWKPERETIVEGDTIYLWTIPPRSSDSIVT